MRNGTQEKCKTGPSVPPAMKAAMSKDGKANKPQRLFGKQTHAVPGVSREAVINQVLGLQQAKEEHLAEFQFRRVRYPFRAPMVFDCRFNGAAEQIVQGRYQAFLNTFYDISVGLRKTGKISCDLDLLTPDMVRILHECQEQKLTGNGMGIRLMAYRNEIAERVSEDLGRNATGDVIRRMGLGDQIVLATIIQAVEKQLGAGSVSVAYDPIYPGLEAIFRMARLRAVPISPDINLADICDEDVVIIDQRRHMLEHPLTDGVPCFYGEKVGDPGRHALWNMGWENSLPDFKVGHPRLRPSMGDIERAEKLVPKGQRFVVCQPLELTRMNKYTPPEAYGAVLQTLDVEHILFGCGPGDVLKLERFVEQIGLPSRFRTGIVSESLGAWTALIGLSAHMVTGNTSGMWLAFSTNCPLTILSKSDKTHGTMWNVKPSWFTPERWDSIRVIE